MIPDQVCDPPPHNAFILCIPDTSEHTHTYTHTHTHYKLWWLFLFLNISFKVCNNSCIMPRFGKNHFHPFLPSVFLINDTVGFEDKFLYIFSCYQTRIFHSKYVIPIVLCLVMTNILFLKIIWWFECKLYRYYWKLFSYTFYCSRELSVFGL